MGTPANLVLVHNRFKVELKSLLNLSAVIQQGHPMLLLDWLVFVHLTRHQAVHILISWRCPILMVEIIRNILRAYFVELVYISHHDSVALGLQLEVTCSTNVSAFRFL